MSSEMTDFESNIPLFPKNDAFKPKKPLSFRVNDQNDVKLCQKQ